MTPIATCQCQGIKQPWHSLIEDGTIVAARLVAERCLRLSRIGTIAARRSLPARRPSRFRYEFPVLLMNKRLERIADRSHLVTTPLELTLEVDEVGGGSAEPLRQKPRDDKCKVGVVLQKLLRVVDYIHRRWLDCLDRRRVRLAEEGGYFAEDRAGLVGDHDPRIAAQNLNFAIDQHIKSTAALALDEKRNTIIKPDCGKPNAGTLLKHR